MPSIFLVRHCEYANPRNILVGRLPVELSEKGIEQANKLGSYLSTKSISRVYSSPVLRCKQTAEIILKSCASPPPIQYDKRLLETLSAYQGFWFDQGEEPDWTHFFSHQHALGGESYADIAKRVSSFWDEVILSKIKNNSENNFGNVMICSHGDELHLMYLYATGQMYLLRELESLNDIEAVLGSADYQRKGTLREVEIGKEKGMSVKLIIDLSHKTKYH